MWYSIKLVTKTKFHSKIMKFLQILSIGSRVLGVILEGNSQRQCFRPQKHLSNYTLGSNIKLMVKKLFKFQIFGAAP